MGERYRKDFYKKFFKKNDPKQLVVLISRNAKHQGVRHVQQAPGI